MEWFEILIIIGAVLFVLSVTVITIYRKKKGKGSCCGDCKSCTCGCINCQKILDEYHQAN